MPAGQDLIDRVYAALHTEISSTPAEVATRLRDRGYPVPTTRAIRYAITALVSTGRARRGLQKHGSRATEIFAIYQKPEAKQPEMQAST